VKASAVLTLTARSGGPVPQPDFEIYGDALLNVFGLQAMSPTRASVGEWDGRDGTMLTTQPGDANIAGSGASERCDLTLGASGSYGNQGQYEWWAVDFLFPSNGWHELPMSPANAQPWYFQLAGIEFHNSASGSGQANVQTIVYPPTGSDPGRNTGMYCTLSYGNQNAPDKEETKIRAAPMPTDWWIRHVCECKWSSASDGVYRLWEGASLLAEYLGPNLYPGQSVYLKLPNYHTAFGKSQSVVYGRVARGKTRHDVEG